MGSWPANSLLEQPAGVIIAVDLACPAPLAAGAGSGVGSVQLCPSSNHLSRHTGGGRGGLLVSDVAEWHALYDLLRLNQHPSAASPAPTCGSCVPRSFTSTQAPTSLQLFCARRHHLQPAVCPSPTLACSVRCWAVAAGVVMFTSELLLAGSLLAFRGGRVISAAKHMANSPATGGLLNVRTRLLNVVVLSILYIPVSACRAST